MSKNISELSPELQALVPDFIKRCSAIGLSTAPTDRPKAEAAINETRRILGLKPASFIWFQSPYEAIKVAAQCVHMPSGSLYADYLEAKEKGTMPVVTKQQIAEQANTAAYGSFEIYWLAGFLFGAEYVYNLPKDHLIYASLRVVENVGLHWSFEDTVVASDKPIAIHLDPSTNQLHKEDGLALEYADGLGVYAIQGVTHHSLLSATLAGKLKEAEEALHNGISKVGNE